MAQTTNEEDFRKGRFGLVSILGGLGLIVLIAGGVYLARKTGQTNMRSEEVHQAVRNTLLRPVSEQTKQWRAWLEDPNVDIKLKQEAIFQLARLRDRNSVPKFIKILNETSNHAMARVISMALLEFPRADGQAAIQGLREKLAKSTLEDEPQIASILVYLRDRESFNRVFEIYKKGVMTSARAVDGTASFDPTALAELTDRATFRNVAKDEKAGIRQLVADVLSMQPDKDDLPTLMKLLQDQDLDVSSSAAVGIAKLNDANASKVLVDKLAAAEKTDNDTARKRYIEALKNGIGGAGLVYALKVMPFNDADLEGRGRFVLEEMRELADPAAAQAYKDYLRDTSNPPHYRSQVALALADIGDPEAISFLAERVDHGGSKSETANLGWKKQPPVDADPISFRENQIAAQDIGDLALLFPEKKAQFLEIAKPHLTKFNSWFPAPWLIVTRALAYLGDRDTFEWCKKEVKAFKLPEENRTEPYAQEMLPFLTATRFVGYSNDASMVDALARWLERPRNKQGVPYIVSQEGMEVAVNQAYRLAYIDAAQAAIDGLAEWGIGASKVSSKLLNVIKDRDHGTFPRLMAGRAFGLVANTNEILAALREVKSNQDADTKIAVLMAAQTRANTELALAALEMITPTPDPAMLAVNKWAARVVGWAGTQGLEERLLNLLNHKELRVYAALAIVLGGDEDVVRRGMVLFRQKSLVENRWDFDLSTLRSLYLDTFDSHGITTYDIDSGRLFRFVRNAELMRRSGSSDEGTSGITPHEWASSYLQTGLQRLDLNATVPGGLSRLILRVRLNRLAKSGDNLTQNLAIDTLRFLKEQGSIMALRNEPERTGELAKQAFFKMRNPTVNVVASEKIQEKSDGHFSKPRK